ncbi:MAG: hypothetical protein HZA17_06620 [Nitrospirae bacterium]|nr:hypothetical protein [Nitrospirota bacterium]
MEKKARPVARCMTCGKISRSGSAKNQRCKNVIDGNKCQGVFMSMLRSDDWQECPSCNAFGKKDKKCCAACSGDGWIWNSAKRI